MLQAKNVAINYFTLDGKFKSKICNCNIGLDYKPYVF